MAEKSKKTATKKAPAKKAAVKKTSAKKAVTRKTAAKKAAPKKTTAKKPAAKKTVSRSPAKVTKPRKAVKKTAAKTVRKQSAKAAPKKPATSTQRPAQKPAAAKANTAEAFGFNFNDMETIMTKSPFQYDHLAQDAANASREGMEAFVKSGTIFAQGFENIIKTAAAMTQAAADKQGEYARQIMGSKSLNEFAETQNKIAQASFDEFMSGAIKLSEMSVKVLGDASEPLNAQAAKAVQKANKAMAA